ncbi:MAG: hypothetical protein QOC62_4263 [Mycobacterium sp.]|jgi:hypothetical protein|nr:hypothetical protein [Mycobacterium sp.]
MLNGATDNMMPIVVDGHDVYLTAMDGVNFPEVRVIPARQPGDESEQVLVATGNRADFLIKGNAKPGIYRIRQLAQTAQFLKSDEKVIAEIEVTGPPKNMALPTKLPIPSRLYPLIKPEEVKRVRMIEFMSSTPGMINLVTGGRLSGQQRHLRREGDTRRHPPQRRRGVVDQGRHRTPRRRRGTPVPHPRQQLRSDLRRRKTLAARNHSRHSVGGRRSDCRHPHPLQGTRGQVRLPLPHTSARGHRHDGELPNPAARR